MIKTLKNLTPEKISLYIFLFIIGYAPVHIFISTWIGTSFGILSIAKLFKDIILIVGFFILLIANIRQAWLMTFIKQKLVIAIIIYSLLTVVMALIKPTHMESELLGILYNLRFMLYFTYAGLLVHFFRPEWLLKKSVRIILTVSVVVMLFGFLQYLVLPDDILQSFGYSRDNGVLPSFYIDNKPDLERATSTLREPNVYGAYLIIIASLLAGSTVNTKNHKYKKLSLGLVMLALLNIYFTFSRSAWIGLVLAAVVFIILAGVKGLDGRTVLKFLSMGSVMVLLCIATVFIFKDTYFVRNVVFHADESTVLEDPNQLRARFLRESVESILDKPLGYGPGTAGLASIRNTEQGTVLNENYYLQIAHEVGLIGLALFLVIIYMVAVRILGRPIGWLEIAILASLAGLSFTNLLVHNWSSEALAYTWWGLAGLMVFSTKTIASKANTS